MSTYTQGVEDGVVRERRILELAWRAAKRAVAYGDWHDSAAAAAEFSKMTGFDWNVKDEVDMEKSRALTPPEVVQALMDGKTVESKRYAAEVRFCNGKLKSLAHQIVDTWHDSYLSVECVLTYGDWTIATDTFGWEEARKRLAAWKTVRRVGWKDLRKPIHVAEGGQIQCGHFIAALTLDDFDATDWEEV